MTHGTSLRETIEELREQEFSDLPSALVAAILEIESQSVEQRDVAVDEVRRAIRAAAQAKVEEQETAEPSEESE